MPYDCSVMAIRGSIKYTLPSTALYDVGLGSLKARQRIFRNHVRGKPGTLAIVKVAGLGQKNSKLNFLVLQVGGWYVRVIIPP